MPIALDKSFYYLYLTIIDFKTFEIIFRIGNEKSYCFLPLFLDFLTYIGAL